MFVPELTKNLLSVSSIAKNGDVVKFDEQKCIVSKEGKNITIGNIVDGKLYRVNTPEFANVATSSTPDLGVWHCRFGNLNHDYINRLAKKQLVDGMKYSDVSFDKECEACALGKMHKLPSPKQSMNRASKPLELIHTALCGPMNVDSIGGSKYMLTFTDDYSRYTTVYFITSKSKTLSKFKEYINMVENSTDQQIKKLSIIQEKKESVQKIRSDNGGEYTSCQFSKFCKDRGISHQFTNPYSPEPKGVSERLNHTLIEAARSVLYHSNVPLKFWAEAVNTAVYLWNRSPTTALDDKTPYECWFKRNQMSPT